MSKHHHSCGIRQEDLKEVIKPAEAEDDGSFKTAECAYQMCECGCRQFRDFPFCRQCGKKFAEFNEEAYNAVHAGGLTEDRQTWCVATEGCGSHQTFRRWRDKGAGSGVPDSRWQHCAICGQKL